MQKPVNLQTPNIIIASYKSGGGGKCILNCLGLSRHMVLQDRHLAQQQLAGDLSPADKFDLLMRRLEHTRTHNTWTDLDLGCEELFGVPDAVYYSQHVEVPGSFVFFPVIRDLSHSDLRFGLVEHSYARIEKKLQLWSQATVIFFYNENDFVKSIRPAWSPMNPLLKQFWINVRGPDWPRFPPQTQGELAQLDPFVQQELKELFHDEILDYLYQEDVPAAIERQDQIIKDRVAQTNTCLRWDCHWFNEPEVFLEHMRQLYESLQFDDFNEHFVREFHRAWLERIKVVVPPSNTI